ncbi:MAG TPA: 4'-phosphopantetheinyl transferase superfamily protein [Luteimonas sp.]|nr:4'-phosphopantetheinyl transferase superfamily protein [Luteimonas sp.]
MSLPPGELSCGPVRCAWRAHRAGTPAEPLVRAWLATLQDAPAGDVPIHRDARGRPMLALPVAGAAGDRRGVRHDLNWSHSGDGLIVALAHEARVGVDLELLRPRPRAASLARRFFTAHEADSLAAWPVATREAAFVRLWCAKEALLKASGHGLSFGLHRLGFTAAADGGWTLVECDPALGAVPDWHLHAFAPAPGYLATVAWRPLPDGAPPTSTMPR